MNVVSVIQNQAAVINLPLIWQGAPYVPDSASYRVRGPGDAVLQDWTTLNLTTDSTVSVTLGQLQFQVPASLNVIGLNAPAAAADQPPAQEYTDDGETYTPPDITEVRLIEVRLTAQDTFGGTQQVEYDYLVLADTPILVLMENSFQLYTDAVATAATVAQDLNYWPQASTEDRIAALMLAYNFLSRLNYEIYYDYDDVYFKMRASWGLPYQQTVGRLYNYTPTEFLRLDPDFIRCIRKAQLVEADDRLAGLAGNSIQNDRREGLVARSVGESNDQYRRTKPLDLMVGKRSLRYLSGYIKFTTRLSRT